MADEDTAPGNDKALIAARGWMRPAFGFTICLCLVLVTYRLEPSDSLPAIKAFLVALAFLFTVRAVFDKRHLERIIAAWRRMRGHDDGATE